MRLFNEVESLGDRTVFYNEPNFDYIEGSGRLVMIRVKDLLESWFAEYPDEHKQKLRRNFRGEKTNGTKMKSALRQSSFHQAFFELYIYVLLRRLGCEVVIEPSIEHLEGKKTRPDFLATHQSTGYSFYVEATVQITKGAERKEEFLERLKAELDQIISPDFVICIDRLRILSKDWTPSPNRFLRYVRKKLSDLEMTSWSDNGNPGGVFNGKGWRASFHFESRADQAGWVRPDRTFKETGSTRADHSTENIRKAIADKACRYGNLDHPFIIAINPMEHLIDPGTVAQSVYGTISHVYNAVSAEDSPIGKLEFSHFERNPNGSFLAHGPQKTRVSTVWIASGLSGPSCVGSAQLYEFENHFAETKFQPPFPCLQKCCFDANEKLVARNGLTPQKLFNIENYWPEDQPHFEIDVSKLFAES